jgi:phosphatidylserine/phosphatidylglycerophosphate/cardiolipin synthase-like enzyme
MTGVEIAFGLRTAAYTASAIGEAERIDLVWTGPKTGLIPTRNTEQVIREVIDEAVEHLFIVSYVFYNAASIVAGLNEAAERGVSVRVLLECPTGRGGAVTGDGLSAMHRAVPKAELYIWSPSEKAISAGALTAAVHAKCAVADDRLAFVTSANLTSAAMERNMELGILVRGGAIPDRLHCHLKALVHTGTIIRWK